MAEELRNRAEDGIREYRAIRDQLEKLSSLEASGEVAPGAATEIREELGGKARDVQERCRKTAGEIEETLGKLEVEMGSRVKEREVIEAKHKIGALDEDGYRERVAALETGADPIEDSVTELRELARRLGEVITGPEGADKPAAESEKKRSEYKGAE